MRLQTRASLLVVLWVAALPLLRAQSAASDSAQPSLAEMVWLLGDWHAKSQMPGVAGKTVIVKSHFGAALKANVITLTMSAGGSEFVNGMFAYDGGEKAVTFWYVIVDPEDADSEGTGTLARGTVRSDHGDLLLNFTATKTDGRSGHLQTRIRRLDADHYRWISYADYPGEGIQKVDEMIFVRG